MTATSPCALSWSGGKDSAMSLLALRADPAVEVRTLVTTVTEGYERIAMHGVRRELLHTQADAAGLPVMEIRLSQQSSNAEYEARMAAACEQLKASGVHRLAYGDLFLEDLKAYRDAHLASAGMTGLYPVWQRDTGEFVADLLRLGFQATVVCVDTDQLDASFAGRQVDESFLADLPATVDPCGEKGEFHTFVHAGPIFDRPIPVTVGEIVRRDRFAYADLLPG